MSFRNLKPNPMPQRLGVKHVAWLLINSTGQWVSVTRTAGRVTIQFFKLNVKTVNSAPPSSRLIGYQEDNTSLGQLQ